MAFKLLDLFCGGGGCGMGYNRAGFEVTGVDIAAQKYYPFEFIQANALEYLVNNWKNFDAIHLSPPCQAYSPATGNKRHLYPDLIPELKPLLTGITIPYIIENVNNAPIRADIVLYGYMFGLKVVRKRIFELGNWLMLQPGIPNKPGSVKEGDFASVFGHGHYTTGKSNKRPVFDKGSIRKTWQYAMGIDWIEDCAVISEAVPPAYTEYIGTHLMQYLINKN